MLIRRKCVGDVQTTAAVLGADDNAAGLGELAVFQRFDVQAGVLRRKLRDRLNRFCRAGNRMAGYGAPAEGATLLNHSSIGPDQLTYVADPNPPTQHRYTPDPHVPLAASEKLPDDQPDYAPPLAWNYAEKFLVRQHEYPMPSRKFIIPVPEARIVGGCGSADAGGATSEVLEPELASSCFVLISRQCWVTRVPRSTIFALGLP